MGTAITIDEINKKELSLFKREHELVDVLVAQLHKEQGNMPSVLIETGPGKDSSLGWIKREVVVYTKPPRDDKPTTACYPFDVYLLDEFLSDGTPHVVRGYTGGVGVQDYYCSVLDRIRKAVETHYASKIKADKPTAEASALSGAIAA